MTPPSACRGVDGLPVSAPAVAAAERPVRPRRADIRYVFLDRRRLRGHVPSAIGEYAEQTGLLKTLAEKRRREPHRRPARSARSTSGAGTRTRRRICREMQSLGIRPHPLEQSAYAPAHIQPAQCPGRADQPLRHLSGRDGPGQLRQTPLACIPTGPPTAWPKDLMIGADGQWVRGWEVEGKDGEWYPCGVLCDRQALAYARRRIAAELEDACRTAAGSSTRPPRRPGASAISPDHPMTRS